MGSKLEFYSLGIVAEDKLETDWEIKVYPMEILPDQKGDLTQNESLSKSVTTNNDGNVSYSVDESKVIKARWLPLFGSNVATAPSVMKGEQVMLINFAGMDLYFWTPVKLDYNLRKKENFIIFLSDKTSIGDTSNEQGYWLAMDTYNKYIKIHTCVNDGEYTTYDFNIRTKDGIVELKDGKGNFIELDSTKDTLTITTLNHFEVNATNTIETNTVDTTHNSEATFVINTKSCTVNAENDATVNTKVATINADDSYTLNTKEDTVNSTNSTINGDSTITCNTSTFTVSSSVCKLN